MCSPPSSRGRWSDGGEAAIEADGLAGHVHGAIEQQVGRELRDLERLAVAPLGRGRFVPLVRLATFALGDDTSTIYCKAFYNYRMKRAGFGATPQPPTDEEKKRVAEQTALIKNGVVKIVITEAATITAYTYSCNTPRFTPTVPSRRWQPPS